MLVALTLPDSEGLSLDAETTHLATRCLPFVIGKSFRDKSTIYCIQGGGSDNNIIR